ncbi:hypothetical protein [Mycobacterium sp.]|uniref:hypothetical protein n=1 Tax=Mycobacterium sp. TaxID=1785 RepID=UPI003C7448CA
MVGAVAIVLRWGLVELAGLARKIAWSDTDEQKAKLADSRAKVLAAIEEAKKSLHGTLAQNSPITPAVVGFRSTALVIVSFSAE